MEEKERYELTDTDCILDTERDIVVSDVCDVVANADIITNLLNQQEKQIKELEKKLDNARQKDIIIRQNCRQGYIKDLEEMNNLREENQQLKQQLNDLPKKIVEEIGKWGQKYYNWVGDGTGYDGQDYNECIGFNMAIDQLNEILDTILKKIWSERKWQKQYVVNVEVLLR